MAYEDFRALDDSIRQDFNVLSSRAIAELVQRFRGRVGELPAMLSSEFDEWCSRLDVDGMARYCGAIASLFRELLVKSGQDPKTAAGTVWDSRKEPWFEVFALKGSRLALEAAVEDGPVAYSADAIGHHIGLHIGEPPYCGEIAWRSVAPCLVEPTFPILPGLDLRPQPMGSVEIRLASLA